MSETVTYKPWPENVHPTPEQFAEWLKVCTDEERLKVAVLALRNGEIAQGCFVRNHDGMEALHHEAVHELTEALRFTVEYVGMEALPPITGWSWFDAMSKYAPEALARMTTPSAPRPVPPSTTPAHDPAEVPPEVPGAAGGGERA